MSEPIQITEASVRSLVREVALRSLPVLVVFAGGREIRPRDGRVEVRRVA